MAALNSVLRSFWRVGVFAAVCVTAWAFLLPASGGPGLRMRLGIVSDHADTFEVFYSRTGEEFSPERSVRADVRALPAEQEVVFDLPADTVAVERLRLDPGNLPVTMSITSVAFEGPGGIERLDAAAVATLFSPEQGISRFALQDGSLTIQCSNSDPFLVSNDGIGTNVRRALMPRPLRGPMLMALLCGIFAVLLFPSPPRGRWQGPTAVRIGTLNSSILFVLILDAFVFMALVGLGLRVAPEGDPVEVWLQFRAEHDDTFQLFATDSPVYGESAVPQSNALAGSPHAQWLSFELPHRMRRTYLRFDPGAAQDSITLMAIEFRKGDRTVPLELVASAFGSTHGITDLTARGGALHARLNGDDPYLTFRQDMRPLIEAASDNTRRDAAIVLIALLATVLVHFRMASNMAKNEWQGPMRARDAVLLLSFSAMMLFPMLATISPRIDPPQPFTEKRVLASMPEFNRSSPARSVQGFDQFYTDNFGTRKTLFRWNSLLMTEVLHTSPLPDRVILGDDDWMYMVNQHVLDDHLGVPLLLDAELGAIVYYAEKRRDELARQGIRYMLVIPPQKSAIYPEHMPARFRNTPRGRWLDETILQFRDHSDVQLVDLREALFAAKSHGEIYLHPDMHWTPFGAFVGYREMIMAIQNELPVVGAPWAFTDFNILTSTDSAGDLAMMIAINDRVPRVVRSLIPLRSVSARMSIAEDIKRNQFMLDDPIRFTQTDSAKPRLLMFHDSFGVYLRPLLAEHFSQSTFIWTEHYDPALVAKVKPDIVVQEVMELFIPNLIYPDRLDTIGQLPIRQSWEPRSKLGL